MLDCFNKNNQIALLICLSFLLISFFSVTGFNWKDLKYSGSAITGDEVAYIGSGYSSLVTHSNFINPEHPPLVKDIAALPLFFLKPTLPIISNLPFAKKVYPYKNLQFAKEGLIKNHQFDWGRLFLFNNKNNANKIVFWSRLAIIIFNSLLLFLLYFSLKHLWSTKVALAALILITILPLSLALGSLVVLDFTVTILQLLAIVWFTIFLQQQQNSWPAISAFILTTLFITLSLLAKSSSLVLLPVLFLVGLIYILSNKERRNFWLNYILAIILMLIIGILAISAYYIPRTSNMTKTDTTAHINYLLPEQDGYIKLAKEAILFLNNTNNVVLRGLSEYFLGVSLNIRRADLSEQQMLYFRGNLYGLSGAGLQYYPVLLLTKIPVAILLLITLAVVYFIIDCCKRLKPDLLFSLFFIYALAWLSLSLHFKLQMGLRYLLPVILIILILTSKILIDNWSKIIFTFLKTKYIFIFLTAVTAVITLISFPYYLSYYNVLAGGSNNGYKIAVDSNYDWGGQDLKKLAAWIKNNKVERIYCSLFTNAEVIYYLGDVCIPYQPSQDSLPVSGSYVAISAHTYQTVFFKLPELKQKYFNQNNLAGRAGKSIFIFKMP